MCTIVFSWDEHPRYRFVFAGNRDEFHQRPTEMAQWWPSKKILAGKDLQAGGTWLALNRHGNFAVVTNFREGRVATPTRRSRGELVTRFFDDDEGPEFRERLDAEGELYSGYNLLFGDLRTALYYHSNRGRSGGLNRGLHGLSNHLLDTPWPKVNRATSALRELLQQPLIQAEQLLEILADDKQAAMSDLPDTGIDRAMEKLLSSVFIRSPDYGTRSSTVILLDREGCLQFVERRFSADGECCGESRFELTLS